MNLNELNPLLTFAVLVFVLIILPSIRIIGPTEVGLVIKKFSFKKLRSDNPIAFNGEPGYQAELLMPGWRFKLWIIYEVHKYPWVQVPAGEIGVVIAQVGNPISTGAKSAAYKKEFGNFTNIDTFIRGGGQKGVQRPVLSPGTIAPIHPVGFLVITKQKIYGLPIMTEFVTRKEKLSPASFGLTPKQLEVVVIEPSFAEGHSQDRIGIVTTLEGDPLPSGDIAGRLGGFEDISKLEEEIRDTKDNSGLMECILGSKNHLHNNYQDFQAFLNNGGKIGLQHDPLLYGAYTLNPFLVSVELSDMLVIEQGEVAVVKAYVGLPTKDQSGVEFKFGSLVNPGHKGIWIEPLRTGKYPINPRCYHPVIVPTSILTLNWATAVSQAHQLDKNLSQIEAKSKEGFVFKIDLQVQIHIPDTEAPKVISIVGTMSNLVSEVLQAAVGNHFRDKLQSMPAIQFIEKRQEVQIGAFEHIRGKLTDYKVETKGVYIQDVILPKELVQVLTDRELANQTIATLQKQTEAERTRIEMEKSKGMANMQSSLSKSKVEVEIAQNQAEAKELQGKGEASYLSQVGTAKAVEVKCVGEANAIAYERQVNALGQGPTAALNMVKALAERNIKLVPDTLITGGGDLGSLISVITGLLSKDVAAKAVMVEKPAAVEPVVVEEKVEKIEKVEPVVKPELPKKK
ncbi:MAG: SPFH domain-containing protein [Candidatus Wallbacteria bacterium]|nr:SPFH domain-containing protein [Candidatus Wallbacteria bacterium]